jgi:predicted enzyme related to lactoylglutathione lyase
MARIQNHQGNRRGFSLAASIGQYGHISLVIDTEGKMIGLHSMQ